MFRRAFYAPLYYAMLFLYNIMAVQPAPFRLIRGCIQAACIAYIAAAYSAVYPHVSIIPLLHRLLCAFKAMLQACFLMFTLHCYYNIKFLCSVTIDKHSIACYTVNSDSAMVFLVKHFLCEFAPESR